MSASSHTGPESLPTVSVVVPTRNRPDHIVACVTSILANGHFDQLIVVDQSDGDETERGLAGIRDERLRYVRTSTRGVTLARNVGIELSKGEIIACTDDDCRAPADWVAQMARVFASDSEIAVVCGRVIIPAEIQAQGYAEGFDPQERFWKGRYPPLGRDWGISANMGLRRSVLALIGVFDPMLGAGAPLRSGGEPDLIFRALRAGFSVVNANEVVLDHLGLRKPGEETRKLIRGYGAGTAAALIKHLRLGDVAGTKVYLGFLGSTVSRVCSNVVQRRRPTGVGYLAAFLSGSAASFRFRVDRARREYIAR